MSEMPNSGMVARVRHVSGREGFAAVVGKQVRIITADAVHPALRPLAPAAGLALTPGLVFGIHEVEFLPPVRPGKIVCVGLNYRDHAEESGMAIPDVPLLFAKLPSSVTGPHSAIEPAADVRELDYEAELAVVIGSRCRDVAPKDSMGHVVAATAANDVSARDAQFADGQWMRGKSMDTFAPVGPWLAMLDGSLDLADIWVRSWVNGELRQESNTRNLIFDVPYLVSYASRYFTLEPGDLLLTGTPAGVGLGFTPPRYLADGDLVEVEVTGVGRLANRVMYRDRDGSSLGPESP